ncbi:MAG: ferritin-like protein [Verrucomicrobiales bacterium]|nr:ferritin-like protein [Verrucomicrobiales bacterium]
MSKSLPTKINSTADLKKFLQTALRVEQATIPPYLCALYSIPDGLNREASHTIHTVVMEEMLHILLVANLINAIGGKPVVDSPHFPIDYPSPLPGFDHLPKNEQPYHVGLEKFSPEAMETFLRIELPTYDDPDGSHGPPATIGQFYDLIRQGFHDAYKESKESLFKGSRKRQVTPEYYYGGSGEVFEVTNMESAMRAIDEIVDQGEGHDGSVFSGQSGSKRYSGDEEPAHYYRFNEIYTGRFYQEGDSHDQPPSGPVFPVRWDGVYNMHPNPKAEQFKKSSPTRKLMDECNQTYTRLLGALDDSFNGNPQNLLEGVRDMYEIKYQAVALMKIPRDDDSGTTAGPAFQYDRPS